MVAPPAPAQPTRDRLITVYGTWRKVRERRPRALSWIESPRETLDAVSGLVMIATALGFLALDAVFQPPERLTPQQDVAVPGGATWLPLAAFVFAAQALLIDRFLDERFSGRGLLPRWGRWVRLGLAGTPLFGLYAIPAWQWLLASRGGARAPSPGSHFYPTSTSPRKLQIRLVGAQVVIWAARKVGSAAGIATLFLVGFAAFYGFSLILPDLCPPSGTGRLAGVGAVLLLHVAGASAVGAHLWIQAQRMRLSRPGNLGMVALALLWLVPVQGAGFLGLLIYGLTGCLVPDPAERSLSGRAFSGVSEVRGLPIWQGLLAGVEESWRGTRGWRALRRPTELRAPRGEGEVESRFFLLCRGKAVLLFLEASALAWALESAARVELLDSQGIEVVLMTLGALSLAGGTVGLAGMGMGFVRKVLRADAETAPLPPLLASASYLAGTQLAACAGLHFGEALGGHNQVEAGSVLALVGLVGALLSIGPIILGIALPIAPTSRGQERVTGFSGLAYCWLAITGLGIARGRPGPWAGQTLEQLLWLGPGLSLLLGAAGLVWLRLALGDGERKTLAGLRTRVEHPWLVVPAVVPFGGLAVPLWVLAWHRRRLRGREPGSGKLPGPPNPLTG